MTGLITNSGNFTFAGTAAMNVNANGGFTNSGTLSVTAASTGAHQLAITGVLTNSGTARFAGGGVMTITVSSDLTNSGTFDVSTASNVVHVLSVGGNLSNTSVFDMATDADSLAQVTFTGNSSATISGNGGTTRFYRLIVSKGAAAANTLDYTATNFQFSASPKGCLVLAKGTPAIATTTNCLASTTNPATGGTFKISTAGTNSIAPFDSAPVSASPDCMVIGSTAGFWLNSATTTVTVNDSAATCNSAGSPANLSLEGSTFRVSAGTLNMNTASRNQELRLISNAASTYWQEGGTANIGGRLGAAAAATDNGVFQMSGGTLNLGTIGNTGATLGPFFLGSGASSTFTMSSGTIVIGKPSSGGANAYDNRAPSVPLGNVTGGLLQIGDAGTAASSTFNLRSDSATIWNLTVNTTNAPTASITTPCAACPGTAGTSLRVRNDLNVGNGATLLGSATDNNNLVVNHDLILGSSATATLNGGGLTVDNDLTLGSSATFTGSPQAGRNISVGDDITIGTGATLNANSRDIAIGGANNTGIWTNNGTFTAGSGTVSFNGTGAAQAQAVNGTSATTFNNLTLNKAVGTATGRTLTINKSATVNGTLTFSGGATASTIATGSNKLSLAAAATVSPSRTTSAASDFRQVVGNLEKGFNGSNTSFTYPIGDGTNFTPITVAFTTLTSNGNLTATTGTSPADHLDTVAGRSGIDSSKSVNRWWTLKGYPAAADLTAGGTAASPGIYTVTLNYLATDLDGGSTASNFKMARGETCATSGSTRTCNPWGTLTISGTPTTTQAASSGVLLVAKDLEADFIAGELPSPATKRFVRQKEFIYTREQY